MSFCKALPFIKVDQVAGIDVLPASDRMMSERMRRGGRKEFLWADDAMVAVRLPKVDLSGCCFCCCCRCFCFVVAVVVFVFALVVLILLLLLLMLLLLILILLLFCSLIENFRLASRGQTSAPRE